MPGDVRESASERVHDVEARSAGLRKELGLRDLVLTQILYVVGSAWVGAAAKLGTSHVVLWLMAIALYYLPQAVVVIYLNRRMPIEGGLYQWAHVGLGRFAGFLTAWNLWAYTVVMAQFAVVMATNVAYMVGPAAAPITGRGWYTPVASALAVVGVTIVSVLGLRVSHTARRRRDLRGGKTP